MTDPVTQPTEAEVEAQALAEAQAGYASRARAEPSAPAQAAEVVQPAASQPLSDSVPPSASTPDPEPAPDPKAEPAAPSREEIVSQQLEDLRAQVRELKASGADAATVRKMHGDIGEINRTLKQFTAVKAADAPADDELAAALKSAETVAEEYPDIAGPIVKALKALQSRANQAPAAIPETEPQREPTQASAPAPELDANGFTVEQRAAIVALDEVHPDRLTLKETPEFKAWYAKWKTPEYREKVDSSWNPAVVAEPFTAFKAHRESLKRKNAVLDAAVQPSGTPATPTPSTLPDEAGFSRGYERVKRFGT